MTGSGAAGGTRGAPREFPVELDRELEAPLPVQLAAALREAIDVGTLRPAEPVPATRELARRLGVARGVVVAAYEQLIAEGYLVAVHGRGTAVNPELDTAPPQRLERAADDGPGARRREIRPVRDPARDPAAGRGPAAGADSGAPRGRAPLAPGEPIPSAINSPAWRAAWREAASRAHLVAPALGDPRLREEVADHLRRMRATARSAADVIVTAGTREGLGLLLTSLGTTRGRGLVVGVEDPGLPSLRGVAARHGARIVALPTDGEGLDTSRLPEGVLDLVIVTPSHQYPLGGSLPLVRRRELLAWARRGGVVIVEDDFDSELRFTGSPLPTLAALDDDVHGSVVLLGTFSRTVAPSLSAGYLLAPEGIRSMIEPVRRELGGPVSSVVQFALAHYLATGELRRHTARLLRRYAERRDLVSDRLAGARGVRVRPMDGGLHAVIEFIGPDAVALRRREVDVVERTRVAGLGAEPLGGYWQRSGAGMSGLVIGLGGSDDTAFEAGLGALAAVLRESPAPRG
ncbi:GntR family transcriptional regulator [Leucobacter komagatae]|uniref:GntR family transcriptional regulator n=1 Tax=Leucobacter komagatae TaxID=55969 RepID=A0A542Y1T9_9MICO|nr:PLP-dependent aminotransferase family protein [Leucobacter komagatae]TQL42046.1 GntR family transcriptional regulator [Leucobacter komagatae]